MHTMLDTSIPDGLSKFINFAYSIPLLSEKEEYNLARDLKDNDNTESAHRLINSHLRLVISIAKKYNGYGLQLADLIQEGTIGLMKAVRSYDVEKQVKLASYAYPWIKSEILEFVVRNWTIVKTATTHAKRKLFFNIRTLQDKSNQQIAGELNVDESEVEEMRVAMAHGFENSIDMEDENGNSVAELVYKVADYKSDPATILQNKQSKSVNDVRYLITQLPEREARIIEQRHLVEEPVTLEVLSQELSISKERVRQLEVKAINSLKLLAVR